MNFIELHNYNNNNPILINVARIEYIVRGSNGRAVLYFGDEAERNTDTGTEVSESYDEVRLKLNQAIIRVRNFGG